MASGQHTPVPMRTPFSSILVYVFEFIADTVRKWYVELVITKHVRFKVLACEDGKNVSTA